MKFGKIKTQSFNHVGTGCIVSRIFSAKNSWRKAYMKTNKKSKDVYEEG